jgi:imidazoleglycerol-phosphate dehydratase
MSKLERETKETSISVEVVIGRGEAQVAVRTGSAEARRDERFLAHMIETLARYAALDIRLDATGDLRHHLVEDVAIALGLALAERVPERAARFGSALIPMDEALAEAAIDVGGRPFYVGDLPSGLYNHFLHSFAMNLGATLHVRVIRGEDRHHMVEAAIKATGMALRQALREGDDVFSTKGSVRLERRD